ncbi:alpha-amylase [Nocardioides sp. MAH-18]|uniref:Alpha-amylase n=1 Tax=Nocardioides agri TaxID=2682843 RepID=A0A6L6XVA4_9ACTN|nr:MULTISPECIES: alpha-amylase family glycosyl hydrolase [unclassified Nocardioides]MBA2956277.1 alpha amylase C-terminal domain-containing protein [Nocardioides sp. CGMCC 1.13656]MVQ51120.1 alpha-amylase [Nocardioides sp. MAH-18]
MRLSSRAVTLSAAVLAVGLLAPVAPATAGRGGHHHPSGGDSASYAGHALRAGPAGEDFYFVMWDRFANGDTGNDDGGLGPDRLVSGFDPTSKGFYNGGDLAGLKDRLDYIEGLGTDAIWLTPVFKNKAVQLEDGPSAGYHGYWITDFTQVDPHLGTNAEMADLVDAAHARGMKVYFDIITNHTADVVGYADSPRKSYTSKDTVPYRTADGRVFDDRDYAGSNRFPDLDPATSFPNVPVLDPAEQDLKVPAWLNDTTMYHNRGDTDFVRDDEDSQYGDFFGLDDLFTERPEVVDGMVDIYRAWVRELGIDGFRIDTMKHVNDEFWQEFGPGILDYAKRHGKRDFFMFGEVALDGSGPAAKAFTSHYTGHNGMQAVLDFPFQDAARGFASKSRPTRELADFFTNDDWYTDADSNAYSLPTFLGNHDMGRFGRFLQVDNGGAGDSELLARDVLAHQLMYLSRGNPIVYYGDEQGFTGAGGDQDARQTMFASRVASYQDDDQIGTDRTPAVDNYVAGHPLYQAIAGLSALTAQHPALRSGAQQVRSSSAAPGVLAFSRFDRRSQREYVVALNNSEQSASADVPTYVDNGRFTRVYGEGPARLSTDGDRELGLTVPALSTVVYASDRAIPRSPRAPGLVLGEPQPSAVDRGRMQVTATVDGSSFYEVTFQRRLGHGPWRTIGTDDSAPYQVFDDVSTLRTGTPVAYRAAVIDNAGHTRGASARTVRVPAPTIRMVHPTGGTVIASDRVPVEAFVDPERTTQSVTFQRRIGTGAWTTLGTDTSSPWYRYDDDLSALPTGTELTYRAILHERGAPDVTSEPVTVRSVQPTVTVAGSLQSEIGCTGDWQPDCAATHLVLDPVDGIWRGTFHLPEGAYEWKIAVNDSWTENYGAGGAPNGGNLSLSVPPGGGNYVFTWDPDTKVPSAGPASG